MRFSIRQLFALTLVCALVIHSVIQMAMVANLELECEGTASRFAKLDARVKWLRMRMKVQGEVVKDSPYPSAVNSVAKSRVRDMHPDRVGQ